MATTVTPSKITDYFPPSPKAEKADDVDSKPETEGKISVSDSVEKSKDARLSTSSVTLTPNPSPAKEKEEESDDKEKTTKEKAVIESACKKSLSENLKQENVIKPPVQSKRRGRRKNNKQTKTDATSDVISNGPAKPKSARKKNSGADTGGKNKLVTDYFAVRRSDRKSKSEIEKEKEDDLHKKILNNIEEGLEVVDIENKGRGVVATKDFLRGDFVVEYAGDLINMTEAKERDEKYSKDPSKGCYMYYFNFKSKNYCIDATEESGKLGRLLNHSKTLGNCHTKLIDVKGRPYLILAASRDIKSGEELLYDYGDRSKAALESHPWLKS